MKLFGRLILATSITALTVSLAGCGSSDPLAEDSTSSSEASETLSVGSANFAESEIIAEIYGQALEAQGFEVERKMSIGAREIYLAALEDGSIDFIPEYSGNLLQYLNSESDAKTEDEVVAELTAALPEGQRVSDAAEAQDKDSWVVTSDFASENNVSSLADLAGLEIDLSLAGNPELSERPYGPPGITEVYGVPAERLSFTPIDDGGGPATVQALTSGEVDMIDVYSTTPAIAENNLVVLEDPQDMILPQNVIPLLSDRVPTEADETLNAVSERLTTEALIEMNARNQGDEKAEPAAIAADWLIAEGLVEG